MTDGWTNQCTKQKEKKSPTSTFYGVQTHKLRLIRRWLGMCLTDALQQLPCKVNSSKHAQKAHRGWWGVAVEDDLEPVLRNTGDVVHGAIAHDGPVALGIFRILTTYQSWCLWEGDWAIEDPLFTLKQWTSSFREMFMLTKLTMIFLASVIQYILFLSWSVVCLRCLRESLIEWVQLERERESVCVCV